MLDIDKRLVSFILNNHLLSLATSKDNFPYSANCYYVYNKDKNCLIFSSDPHTNHAKQFIKNNNVAATIAIDNNDYMQIKGVQLLGKIQPIKLDDLKSATQRYLAKYPYAKDFPLHLWFFEINFIKMVDNNLGFGKNIIWKKD
jgi:uncharacterized protein